MKSGDNCYEFLHRILSRSIFPEFMTFLDLNQLTFSAASFSLAKSLRRSLISAFKSSLFLSNSFTFSLRTLAVPPAAPPVSGPYFYNFNKQNHSDCWYWIQESQSILHIGTFINILELINIQVVAWVAPSSKIHCLCNFKTN